MDARWRICLLGGLRVEGGDRVLTRFRTQKAGVLLAYLAYHLQRPHLREQLIEMLWPESELGAGRNNLSKELYALRQALEPPGVPRGRVLTADRALVRLNPEVVTTDVAAFEAALNSAECSESPTERASHLAEAVEGYGGELLPGYYADWVLQEREWLAERYFRALSQLLADLETTGDLSRALEYARRGIRADPLREEAHRDLMRLFGAVSQPAAALRQYHELKRLLKQELDAEPSPKTQALARKLTALAEGGTPGDQIAEAVGGGELHSVATGLSSLPTNTEAGDVPTDLSRALPGPPRLPAWLTRFFGREAEVAHLRAMLVAEQRRLVTLTGSGGSGKTRLAVEVARGLVEAFQGAVWFVSLADLSDARLIGESVRDALRLPRSPSVEPLEQVAAALGRQPALLLLDNFEHLLAQGVALVRDLLERVETLTVLVTSRQRLDLAGERELAVLPLPIPRIAGSLEELIRCESVQIFIDRAQAVRSEFEVTPANARAVAELCRRLEGIPLAVELAAARAQVLTPAQMLAQIADRFDLLVSWERDVPARHRTLRTALDWSYQLLLPQLKQFFARLSVFRGGWTAKAAAAVCEEPKTLEYLEVLRECSLVVAEERAEEMRFQMLETLREYAREQLTPEEQAGLEQRHAAHYMALAEQAMPELHGPAQGRWLERLEQEHDNLRVAMEELEEEAAYLVRRAALGEAVKGRELQESPLDSARLAKWGQIVEHLAPAYGIKDQSKAAQRVLQGYISLCEQHGYARGIARGYTLLGMFPQLNLALPRGETSQSMLERAIAVCEAHGLMEWVVHPQGLLAQELIFCGVDLERGEALVNAILPLAVAQQETWLLSRLYTALLWTATKRADWEEVKDTFRASLVCGGPYPHLFLRVLADIEEQCHRLAADHTFVSLCHDLAAECTRAGREPPLQQWYLAPTCPGPTTGEPWLQEEFDAEGWHPALQWRDATGRSHVDRAARPGWLGFSPAHDCDLLPVTNLNAPRLVATAQGDFVAQACVKLGREVQRVNAGLLVWQDEQHFARLELWYVPHQSERLAVHLQACVAGRWRYIGHGYCDRDAMWLRVERTGEELRGLCSEDGEQWLTAGSMRFPLGETIEVGLAAICHEPGVHAWFDTFLVW